jgi:hypothetical protein
MEPLGVECAQMGHDSSTKLSTLLWAGLAFVALLTICSWALVAVVHVDDTYHVGHVSGAWLALADYANDGTLYPPLFDGTAFGGTRYMPLQILAYAGAADVVGSDVLAAKLVVYATAILLCAVIFLILGTLGCPIVLRLGLLAALLAAFTGFWAATAVSGDTLPLLLQLTAVALATRGEKRSSALGAGLLCALAVLSKSTALWAPAAILIWLLWRDRGRTGIFVGSLVGTFVAGIALFAFASEGRLFENILGLSGSSFLGFRSVLLDSPGKFIDLMEGYARPIAILMPFALLGLFLAAVARRITIYHLSFVLAFPILLVVFADPGTSMNQLVDVCALTVIVAGGVWGQTTPQRELAPLSAAIVLALIWSVGVGFHQEVRPDAIHAAKMLLGRADRQEFALRPPADQIQPTDRIFSEDPYVPVSLGQHPVVLDSFMLLRIGDKHPEWRSQLIARLDAREFDKVVLMRPLDDSTWWQTSSLGSSIVDAIGRNYRATGEGPGWRGLRIYIPRGRSSPTTPSNGPAGG